MKIVQYWTRKTMTKSERDEIKEILRISQQYNMWDKNSMCWTLHQITNKLEDILKGKDEIQTDNKE